MNERKTPALLYPVTILFALLAVFPVIWVILSSFKPQSELFSFPMTFLSRNVDPGEL